jgi:hypothetical protein
MYLPIHFQAVDRPALHHRDHASIEFSGIQVLFFSIIYKNYDLGKIRIEKTTPVY